MDSFSASASKHMSPKIVWFRADRQTNEKRCAELIEKKDLKSRVELCSVLYLLGDFQGCVSEGRKVRRRLLRRSTTDESQARHLAYHSLVLASAIVEQAKEEAIPMLREHLPFESPQLTEQIVRYIAALESLSF